MGTLINERRYAFIIHSHTESISHNPPCAIYSGGGLFYSFIADESPSCAAVYRMVTEHLAPEASDEELAEQVKQGDKNAFGILVERYEKKLLRYGNKFLSDGEDVKDIVQDVFMRVYQNIQSWSSAQKFSPWIYRIAHNAFVNGLKKKSRNPFVFFDFDVLLSYGIFKDPVEDERNQKEMRAMIDQGLNAISRKYKEIIILYYLEEIPYKEIADILQIPVGTVGVRLQRAKNALRAAYKKMHITYGE